MYQDFSKRKHTGSTRRQPCCLPSADLLDTLAVLRAARLWPPCAALAPRRARRLYSGVKARVWAPLYRGLWQSVQRRICARTAHLPNGRDDTLCVLQHRHCCPHRRHSHCVLHRRLLIAKLVLYILSQIVTHVDVRRNLRHAGVVAPISCASWRDSRCKRRVVDRRILANEPRNHAHLPGVCTSRVRRSLRRAR